MSAQRSLKIPLKQWLYEEGQREHVTPHAIWNRLRIGKRHRDKYAGIVEEKINQRLVFVHVPQ